jgi:hypothetical protein
MIAYSELQTAAKLGLTDADFNEAVRLEAAKRGVRLPIPVADLIEHRLGYTRPVDAVTVFEIMIPSGWSGSQEPCKLAFKTSKAAEEAMEGALCLGGEGYGDARRTVLRGGAFGIRQVPISVERPLTRGETVKPAEDAGSPEFDALVEELMQDWKSVASADVAAKVRARQRDQYIELAKGDEDIAKAFWAKAYPDTDWPVTE